MKAAKFARIVADTAAPIIKPSVAVNSAINIVKTINPQHLFFLVL